LADASLDAGRARGSTGRREAIAKYVARREKDIVFTRALAGRGMVEKAQLLALLAKTPIDAASRNASGLYL